MSRVENEKRYREMNKSVNRPIEDWKKRRCLSCDKMFLSTGKFNRVCAECKRGSVYAWDVESHSLGRKR